MSVRWATNMSKRYLRIALLSLISIVSCVLAACGGGGGGGGSGSSGTVSDRCRVDSNPYPQDCFFIETYDVNANGIPKFVTTDYIELPRIVQVSRFRSAIGHDYSDDFERCRSMKHYFAPKLGTDWTTVKVFSPVDGTVTNLINEGLGFKVEIKSKLQPAFHFQIFHVNLIGPLKVFDVVAAGQVLGTHASNSTTSDIAVGVVTPQDGPYSVDPYRHGGWKLLSYFDVMSDPLFQTYQARSQANRSDFVITEAERDAHPLVCNSSGGFTGIADPTVADWVILN
jgi:hypothetical protein